MDYAAIARRIERKLAIASVQLSTSSLRVGGGLAAYSGPGGYANRACGMALEGPVTEQDVETVIEFFESRGDEAKVEICPFTHDSLVQALSARGFVVKHFVNVHAVPLTPMSVAGLAIAPPDGVIVDRVDRSDLRLVRAFVEANERGFAPEGTPVSQMAIDLTMKAVLVPTNDSFMARTRSGEIVGVASSESSDGLTVLFGATVVPAWRHRGLQRALMITRLAYGILRGSDLACVATSPGIATERNAARLGFAMAYTRIALRRPRAQ